MPFHRLLRLALLAFLAVCLTVIAVKVVRRATRPTTAPRPVARESRESMPVRGQVVAYYFHGKFRCAACANLEAYTREAVTAGFPEEIRQGRLAWRVVDFDGPGNEHFATEYKLAGASVVLIRFRDGKQVQWELLPEVWELLHDKEATVRYIRGKVRSFLEAR